MRVILLLPLLPLLGACHRYYFAQATIPLSAPVDTSCLRSQLTDGGYKRLKTGDVAYSTPAMFRQEWSVVGQVVQNDWRFDRGEVVPDSSATLAAVAVQINRRFAPHEGPSLTGRMTRHLFDLRDRCGGRSPGGEQLFAVAVDDAPYRAWTVRGTDGRVALRVTTDSLRYVLGFPSSAGRSMLRVDTLADDARPRSPRWIEVHAIPLPPPPKGTILAADCWRGDSMPTGALVSQIPWTNTRYLTDARQVWEFDPAALRIRDVAPEGIECLNSAWTPIVPGAPRALRAAALTFRPTPGKARIYAYLSLPNVPTSTAVPYVAVDDQLVGQLDGGSFLMVEVDPGPHRVSAPPGKQERAVLLETAADSCYFVELRRAFWAWAWRANVRPMDPGRARAAIRRAHMAVGDWPARSRE